MLLVSEYEVTESTKVGWNLKTARAFLNSVVEMWNGCRF